jgi:hypothetical protein
MDPVKSPEEARSKVATWAVRGAIAIKIYANAEGDVMQAAIDEAHEHSMKVWAHVGAVTFQQAMDMGVDQLFHGSAPWSRLPTISCKSKPSRLEAGRADPTLEGAVEGQGQGGLFSTVHRREAYGFEVKPWAASSIEISAWNPPPFFQFPF